MPSPTPLTPSEIVLVHGNRFAETKRPVGLALGLLLGIIVLLYFVFSELAAVHHTWSSRHWPHTEGKIVVSQVSASPEHKPQIKFSYEVENRTYTSETVWFGVDHKSFEEGPAAALVARYPVGGVVTVTYDPKHPETAVLETGLRSSTVAGVLFGLLFVLVAAFVLAIQMPLLFARKPEG